MKKLTEKRVIEISQDKLCTPYDKDCAVSIGTLVEAINEAIVTTQESVSKSFLDTLRNVFSDRLGVKTNWGRNQIIGEFEFSISEALLKIGDHDVKEG